jgi:hypothetical protein
MPNGHVFYSTYIMHWKNYGTSLPLKTFPRATSEAFAAQCIQRNGKFYWYSFDAS